MKLITLASALLPYVLGKQGLSSRQNSCNTYVVSGISGGFTEKVSVDFTSAQSGGNAATFLSQHALSISDYSVGSAPIAHDFIPGNFPSYGGSGSVESAEVVTDDTFTYPLVRTVLKSSTTTWGLLRLRGGTETTDNVEFTFDPSQGLSWVGGAAVTPYWSNGPPTAGFKSLRIRSIELYKGYTSTTSGHCL
ncbi:hypothetical protein F5146DRAFT_1039581, partial [Armillaria mellea]